jgi:hypothetical protein
MTSQTAHHAFPLDGPINLDVRIGHGSVTVETDDDLAEATVEIRAHKGSGNLLDELTVEMRGPTLTVQMPMHGGIFDLFGGKRALLGRGAIDVHVVVPAGTAAKIHTFTAPIRVLGRVSGADLAFGHGEAALRDVDGDLRLRFGNGTAKAVHVGGSVDIRSGAGNASFGEVDGNLRSATGSGDLSVHVMRGAVTSRCGSGAARLGEVHGDVDMVSGSGMLEIGLPPRVNARLDVQTSSGSVHTDMPIDDAPAADNPSIRVRARTAHGDVRLFRADGSATSAA